VDTRPRSGGADDIRAGAGGGLGRAAPERWRAALRRRTPFLFVVALAAFLRLWRPDLIEFKGDEALYLGAVASAVAGGAQPTLGIVSSVGVHQGPLFIYLLELPYALGHDPRWVTAFVALTNVLAVALTYLLAERLFGRRAAFVAGIAFAVCPWAVIFSRKIRHFFVLPCVVAPLLLALRRVAERPQSPAVAAVPVLLCAAWQFHYSAYAAIAAAIVFLAVQPGFRRISWRWLGAGALGAAVLAGPYLGHLARTGFADVSGTAALVIGAKPDSFGAASPAEVFRVAAQSAAGSDVRFWLGDASDAFAATHWLAARLGVIASVLAWTLMAIGAAVLVIRLASDWRRKSQGRLPGGAIDPAPLLVLIWIAAAPLAYLLARLHVESHYFIVSYPAPFLLLAAGAEGLFSLVAVLPNPLKQGWRAAVGLAVAGVVVGQSLFLLGFFSFLGENGGAPGDYGVIYRHKAAAVDFIASRTPAGANPSVTTASGDGMAYLIAARFRERNASRRFVAPDPAAASLAPVFTVYDDWRTHADLTCRERRDFGPLIVCQQ
jgi:hypothetical protein